MKKRKTYEVSVVNKTYSKVLSDRTKFYTSDTALELVFKLKEVEYDFDSAELILLNDEDRSLTTRPVKKTAEGFTYELEDDVVEHYGTWSGQLKFTEDGEYYISSPIGFTIYNDLTNARPPKMTEVNTWKNLRKIADGLISDIRNELESAVEQLSEIEDAESERQSAELIRIENENQRNLTSVEEFVKLQDAIGGRNVLSNNDIISAALSTFDKSNYPQVRFKPNDGIITAGIKLRDSIFEVGEQYTISFTIQNQEGAGEIYGLGGHATGFNVVSVSVDGEVQNANWSGGTLKYGFGYSEHEIVIKVIATGASGDNNFYIQPNRGGTVFNMYNVILNNIKVEKGTQPTPYTKAPEDYTTVSKDDYYNYVKLMNDFKENQTELAIDTAGKVKLTNLIKNGNISRGLESWSNATIQSTLSIENGNLKVTFLDKVDNLLVSKPNDVVYTNNMYYSIVRFNPVNLTGSVRLRHNNEYRVTQQIGVPNEFQTISTVFNGTGSGNHTEFRVFALDTKAGDYFYIDHFMLFDLTTIFGAGNEPTKEEMDELIKITGYIDGEYALSNKEMLSYLMNDIREKANKKQGDWITPTLLNGWDRVNAEYMKDSLGFVHLRGYVRNGTLNTVSFSLPSSHAPSISEYFTTESQGTSTGVVYINSQSNGTAEVLIRAGDVKRISLSGITFQAKEG